MAFSWILGSLPVLCRAGSIPGSAVVHVRGRDRGDGFALGPPGCRSLFPGPSSAAFFGYDLSCPSLPPVSSSLRAAFFGFDLFVTFFAACFLPSCLQCLCPASWRDLAVFFGYGMFVSFYTACFLVPAVATLHRGAGW